MSTISWLVAVRDGSGGHGRDHRLADRVLVVGVDPAADRIVGPVLDLDDLVQLDEPALDRLDPGGALDPVENVERGHDQVAPRGHPGEPVLHGRKAVGPVDQLQHAPGGLDRDLVGVSLAG